MSCFVQACLTQAPALPAAASPIAAAPFVLLPVNQIAQQQQNHHYKSAIQLPGRMVDMNMAGVVQSPSRTTRAPRLASPAARAAFTSGEERRGSRPTCSGCKRAWRGVFSSFWCACLWWCGVGSWACQRAHTAGVSV